MLKTYASIILLFLTFSSGHGKSLIASEPNPKFSYLTFKSYLDLNEKTPPEVQLFDNPEFKGKPVIALGHDGLKIKDEIVCVWNKGYANDLYKRFLINKGGLDNCEALGDPLFSNESPGGTPLLWIELQNAENRSYYEVQYQGKTLYIEKSKSSNYVFNESRNRLQDKEIAKIAPLYQKTLAQDSSLQEFIKKFHNCFKNRDLNCLQKDQDGKIEAFSYFQRTICTNGELDTTTPILRSCQTLETNCKSDESQKLTICKKVPEARKKFEDYFWKVYGNCFFSENGRDLEAEVSFYSSDNVWIKFHAKDYQRISCTAVKRNSGNKVIWSLFTGE
ncbi:MAG: hypothetical protein JNM24_18820 [Bdellovibrionaceae bacterium]|nr:hypothetical protein [Pseudobdellovibrionaceae bacterium]